jgi:hypothetical protein
MRDGKEACSHGRWLNADQLEIDVYWALQQVEPQDLEAQIQALIDQERAPESEIEAAHMLLEDVARQREKYQRMAARDLITLEELEQHVGVLNQQRDAAERELERLTSTEERIERLRWIKSRLRWMKSNPILTWLHSEQNFEGSRRDYYQNLGLRVVADRGGVEVNGSQIVTPTSTSERSR